MVVMVFDPWDLVNRSYHFNKRISHIGSVKLGLFAFSDDVRFYRIASAGLGLFLVILGSVVFASSI